jgi:hypothetical protein
LPGFLVIPQDRVSMGEMLSETKSFTFFRIQLIDYNLPGAVKTQLDLDARLMIMKRSKGSTFG